MFVLFGDILNKPHSIILSLVLYHELRGYFLNTILKCEFNLGIHQHCHYRQSSAWQALQRRWDLAS